MHYMSKDVHESEIVLARMEQVCPSAYIEHMYLEDIRQSVKIAFEIIGYKPHNLVKCTDKALGKMNNKGELYRLCYNAWRLDDE